MKQIIFLILINFTLASSQDLYIQSLDLEGMPNIKAEVYPFTNEKTPAQGLLGTDFTITDVENRYSVTNYTTPEQNLYAENSIIFYVDLNLFEGDNSATFKSLLKNVISEFDDASTKIKIVGFDRLNYLYYDSEDLYYNLEDALDRLDFEFFSDPWQSLEISTFNPIDLLSNDDFETKQIAILTNSLITLDATLEISNRANSNDIKINCFHFSDLFNPSFNSLAEETNGFYWQGSNYNLSEKLIISKLKGYKSSEIEWEISGACVSDQSGTISLFESTYDKFQYQVPDSIKPRLEFSPKNIELKNILPFSNPDPTEIFIKAVNSDITIYDIQLTNDYGGVFSLTGAIDENNDEPVRLTQGGEYGLQLTYAPVDSAISFTQIRIKSDACFGDEIKILGGFPNVAPNEPTIQVLKPECGETLFSGTEYEVEWTGLLPQDIIQLEYSVDNGRSWDTLAKNVNGLTAKWRVPEVETDSAWVRAIQLWPNNIGKTLNLNHRSGTPPNFEYKRVNSAFFDPTGSYVVTTSEDGIVRVWESNTGELLGELEGHSSEVNWAVYSPNGNYIASCDDVGNAYLWYGNPNSSFFGEQITAYNGHSDQIYSIQFSPNGEEIITACQDGKFRRFNALNGVLIYEGENADDRQVRFATYTPDGNTYLIGGRKGVVYQFDINSNNEIRTFDIRDEGSSTDRAIDHIAVSPDSRLIAVSSEIRKLCKVWNIETGETVYDIYQDPWQADDYDNRKKIYSSHFFYSDEDSVLITAGGFEAIRWDLTTGDSTALFSEHDSVSTIRTASYNFDGSRVLTSSWDGTAKVWNLSERDLQMDSTDCAFKIRSVSAEASNIAFESEVIPGKKFSNTFSNFIQNTSSSSFNINSVEIFGEDRRSFQLEKDYNNQPIYNSAIDLLLSFIPQREGENTAQIRIIIPSDTLIYSITGFGRSRDFELLNNIIDFGDVELESIEEKNDLEIWRNISGKDLVIDSVKLFSPYPERFGFIERYENSEQITDQSIIPASLRYLPDTLTLDNAALKIYHSGEYKSEKVLLLGRGVPIVYDSLSFSFSDFEANAGERVTSKIILENITDEGIDSDITGLEFNFDFNASLLIPKFETVFDSIGNDRRFIKLVIPFDKEQSFQDGDIFRELEFVATLGNDSTTNLNIETVTQIGQGNAFIDFQGSTFRLLDLCYEGGARLVETFGRFNLEQNFPNPATGQTEIRFEVIEKGRTTIKVYSSNGDLLKVALDEVLNPGKYEKTINAGELPAGTYFYILESPNLSETKRMIIQK